jgi:hypothetical protein
MDYISDPMTSGHSLESGLSITSFNVNGFLFSIMRISLSALQCSKGNNSRLVTVVKEFDLVKARREVYNYQANRVFDRHSMDVATTQGLVTILTMTGESLKVTIGDDEKHGQPFGREAVGNTVA